MSAVDFTAALEAFGVQLTAREVTAVVGAFGDGGGGVLPAALVVWLRGELSPLRVGLVEAAYALIQSAVGGIPTLIDILRLCNPRKVPGVLAGVLPPEGAHRLRRRRGQWCSHYDGLVSVDVSSVRGVFSVVSCFRATPLTGIEIEESGGMQKPTNE
jgi:hypothetical protein